jgi:hypothetical protein
MTVTEQIAKDRELLERPTTVAPFGAVTSALVHMDEWMQLRSRLSAALAVVEAAEAVIVERNESTYCKTCHGRTLDMSGIEKHKPWCPIPGLLDALSAYGGER